MAMRIPPLLEPYLRLPPESSLIVLTHVLGASTNWLVQRYLCSLLGNPGRGVANENDQHATADKECSVVLVSFMRDYAFWKEGAGRLGLDLDALSQKRRFSFVDGLSQLFTGASGDGSRAKSRDASGQRVLQSSTLQDLRSVVSQALAERTTRDVVLILDNPDLLLSAAGSEMTAQAVRETLLDLRETVSSTIVTLAVDEPLVSAQATSLEKEQASLVLSLAHEAELLLSLRLLDTGTARDVSGVLRVTHGGASTGLASEERELLYFVGGDGGTRVFERGQ
ncbi:hypothetical protein JX266_002790 [Neoarthrinium moseri]|nr:hypothetical protein JX266_002790 [Neoarthrinium moseri]